MAPPTTRTGIERDAGEPPIAPAIICWSRRRRRRRGEKLSAACELGAAVTVGEEAVMADAVEAVRQLAVGRRKRRLSEDEIRLLGRAMREAEAAAEHPTALSAIRVCTENRIRCRRRERRA
jgi:hypothetical protein